MIVGMAPSDLSAVRWPRTTQRLVIRPFTAEDSEPLWQVRRKDSVATWIYSTAPDFGEFALMMADPVRMAKTLVIERDGVVIGDLMIAPEDAWGQLEVADRTKGTQAELGWVIDPAVEGHGYATEAVRELIRLCFEDLGMRRVIAQCFAANEASWRLMERVGMRREAYNVADSLHRSGEWMDGIVYALLADEWLGLATEQPQET